MDKEEKLAYHREYNKEWYKQNKDKKLAYDVDYRIANQEKSLYKSAKHRAKNKGLDFNLDITDIVIPEYCPILGVKLTKQHGAGRVKTNPSIDRIDPSKGYVKGNVWVISDLANRMKQDANEEELTAFAKYYHKPPATGTL